MTTKRAQLLQLGAAPSFDLNEEPKDRYRTPPWLFAWASAVYGPFDVDLCADHHNALCRHYFTRSNSCLLPVFDWLSIGARGFCNPPFSDPKPFVYAAIEYARRGFSTFMVLPTHVNQVWAAEAATWATERIEMIGRVDYWKDDGSGKDPGNRGGTQLFFFRGHDLGYTRTRWVRTRALEEAWS